MFSCQFDGHGRVAALNARTRRRQQQIKLDQPTDPTTGKQIASDHCWTITVARLRLTQLSLCQLSAYDQPLSLAYIEYEKYRTSRKNGSSEHVKRLSCQNIVEWTHQNLIPMRVITQRTGYNYHCRQKRPRSKSAGVSQMVRLIPLFPDNDMIIRPVHVTITQRWQNIVRACAQISCPQCMNP
ncbi:hypothetical protein EDD16DRAFT_1671464 [Pisolithus croceorrhizus]|nr:hypothetical protein EDD16DRAFT_1671464 [Pisolithus croceorrhizus]